MNKIRVARESNSINNYQELDLTAYTPQFLSVCPGEKRIIEYHVKDVDMFELGTRGAENFDVKINWGGDGLNGNAFIDFPAPNSATEPPKPVIKQKRCNDVAREFQFKYNKIRPCKVSVNKQWPESLMNSNKKYTAYDPADVVSLDSIPGSALDSTVPDGTNSSKRRRTKRNTYYEGKVINQERFRIFNTEGFTNGHLTVRVYNAHQLNLAQKFTFDPSCDRTIRTGDTFGSLRVIGFTNEKQGQVRVKNPGSQ